MYCSNIVTEYVSIKLHVYAFIHDPYLPDFWGIVIACNLWNPSNEDTLIKGLLLLPQLSGLCSL